MKLHSHLILVLFFVALGVATHVYEKSSYVWQSENFPNKLSESDGQEVYMTRCMSCHGATGEGVPGVFPPLTDSKYVSADKGVFIRMILNGLRGEVVVKGVTYNGMMPPWGGFLTDQQVADVTTFVRSNFGNEADAITPEEVALVRKAVEGRTDAWTVEELALPENQGIPGK